ncbi:hypothetical protein [Trebonia sp.]|uniref:hypothetical protein n=1 Tax=Trebonia sp. TaxID=2767075 RepID=UPI003BAED606
MPRSSEATAAIRQAAIAKSNATDRPAWNGAEIRLGKNEWPVRKAWLLAGSLVSTGPSSIWIGL